MRKKSSRKPAITHRSRSARSRTSPSRSSPSYALRRGLGIWQLIFNGLPTVLKHEQGVPYVAYLLLNPPAQPIHALDLIAKVRGTDLSGLARIVDLNTGAAALVSGDSRMQERALGLDDAETLRALRRKERELEAILDAEDHSEPVKAEAVRELDAIADYRRQHARRCEGTAERAVRAVRKAINRFHNHLATACDGGGRPHQILVPFASHLERHLLIPSGRYSGRRCLRARSGLFGCFTYEPPNGVRWES